MAQQATVFDAKFLRRTPWRMHESDDIDPAGDRPPLPAAGSAASSLGSPDASDPASRLVPRKSTDMVLLGTSGALF